MRHCIFLIFFILPFSVLGQFPDRIDIDRPGNTISPHTVGANIIQVQAGYDFSQFERNGFIGIGLDAIGNSNKLITRSNLSNTNVKLRFGLGERFEFFGTVGNLQTETLVNGGEPRLSDSRLLGIGYRMNLYEGNRAIPSVGFEANVSFIDGDDFIYFNLALANKIGDRFGIGVNAQWFIEGSYFFTARPLYRISERLSAIAEYELRFGSIQPYISYPVKGSQNFASVGLTFHISDNFIADFLAGGLINSPERHGLRSFYQIQGGLSYRLKWRD